MFSRGLFVSAIFVAVALAQVDTGTISGLIHDPSGAAIPGVQVSIKAESTGLTTNVVTNDAGLFVSPPLRAGGFVVEAQAKGFEPAAKRMKRSFLYNPAHESLAGSEDFATNRERIAEFACAERSGPSASKPRQMVGKH